MVSTTWRAEYALASRLARLNTSRMADDMDESAILPLPGPGKTRVACSHTRDSGPAAVPDIDCRFPPFREYGRLTVNRYGETLPLTAAPTRSRLEHRL